MESDEDFRAYVLEKLRHSMMGLIKAEDPDDRKTWREQAAIYATIFNAFKE